MTAQYQNQEATLGRLAYMQDPKAISEYSISEWKLHSRWSGPNSLFLLYFSPTSETFYIQNQSRVRPYLTPLPLHHPSPDYHRASSGLSQEFSD